MLASARSDGWWGSVGRRTGAAFALLASARSVKKVERLFSVQLEFF